ncbi:DJ-1 family glyoxalase III [Atopobium sp. oral taxon 199]|uniref:DJ-1 family glyoxalase III n=1 Tax=Atopobium sp. oral taxon 199 TaxID=712156 RepID=UPI00034E8462|nr:DJ-1 family glyoxalase III [Atopobium sp. oral taxon 199]EPD77710.1 4-methyl-5(b-hydroxyethyl)-thiazole monophosphate biosynthesis protein [Atopobium sp. oral taxon 199 str. F0494]
MFKKQTDQHVAVFFADGCEEIEGLTVVDLLFRAGIPCDKVSISDTYQVTSSHEVTFLCNKRISDIDFDDYAMLVLPGGIPGTPNLAASESLMRAIGVYAAQGKALAAICAAPSIYAEQGLLEGVRATANPDFQHVLSEKGAVLAHDPVVVDGSFITSQGAGTAMLFALEIVRYFLGDEAVRRVRESVVL